MITVRIPRDILDRIDAGAERPGAERQQFIVESVAEKLEQMEER